MKGRRPKKKGLKRADRSPDVSLEQTGGGLRRPSGIGSQVWFVPAACLILGALALGLYLHTLPFPFVFDDCVYLTDNPFAFGENRFGFLTDPCGFATAPARLGLDPDFALNIMLRPFAYLTFYFNYLWGGLDPRGYRLVNIILHGLNGVLIFAMLRHLVLRSRKQVNGREGCALFLPLAAALLFVAHPLQTESVTYVIQRFTCLGAFFTFAALWLHLRANAAEKKINRALLRAATMVTAALGMLSKESAATVPVVAVLLDTLVMGTRWRTALRRAMPLLLTMVIVPGLVLFTTWAENNGKLTLSAAINIANRDDVPRSHYEYFLTSLRVIVAYLRLLILPIHQNLDPKLEWSTSAADGRVLWSAGCLVAIVLAAWLAFRRRASNLHASLILAFTSCYFAWLAISSGLVPLPDVMAEHRTYKSSIGFFVVLVCLIDLVRQRFLSRGWRRGVAPAVILVWTSFLACATLARNEVWRSDITLWEDTTA
ncbi:MAG TPA: hypothetical protein VGH65_00150, partial [Verrucomicrobiaceae bacterium]